MSGRRDSMATLPPITGKDGGMLELADTTANGKNDEESKRKKAKLLKKLKEQEGLANANNAVMVRDRRRPRKSIKEMSVLNKRRRVIKNTARKEIAQQKATLESMRHIELKRYSLEARELELFVERVQKVKENKRLTMLFAKFKVEDSDDSDNASAVGGRNDNKSASNTSNQDGDQASDTTSGDKKTESMNNLLDELNNMSNMIDFEKNPQWKYIMQGQNKEPVKKETSEQGSPEPVSEKKSPVLFGSRFKRGQALEAPAELQTINRFPSIGNGKITSKDDSELKGYGGAGSVRRCASQPVITNNSSPGNKPRQRRISYDVIPSMPTLYSDVELSTRDNTVEQIDSRAESFMEESIRPKPPYHTNWREREKRGDSLYSPVALSPIQSGLFSPDFIMDEDELTANYRKKINPKKFQQGLASSAGDMEFSQAMTKMPSKQNKQVAYTGTESIIEMQLNSKTKHIADKVSKVRAETIRPTKKAKDQGAKNIAQIIHQSGEGTRFIEELKILRSFASLCNCKYLRTDPERLDERRNAYIETLMDNVSKRVQIRNKWKMGMRSFKLPSQGAALPQPVGISLPIISQGGQGE
ncbi:uncharacterized protein LOC134814287 isoform X3 [Bolinopsis microptera]|uniref:uncharacterized protein LOC134814287 isoform X3 n=1 Tax=Bolinopsis microptera TaxID=2820187 RepID=UPI003079CD08